MNFVSDYLPQHGVESHIINDNSGTKANLLVTTRPKVAGGIMLSANTDMVSVDGQYWDTNPFIATRTDDRAYGQGTTDMKRFSTIFLAHLPRLCARQT
tara:strand:+ start:7286 stop:7579 length:294 start_codon:yes stop_codon:yes gene_type:complete